MPLAEAPRFEAVIEQLNDDALRCAEGPLADLTGPWPEGGALHFYRHGLATRSVELASEDGTMTVRVLALSSPDEYDLAFRFVEVLGGDREIEHEEHGAMPASEARARLGNEWMLREMAASHAAILSSLREHPHYHVEVQGAVRGVAIGPKMLERVGESAIALLDAIRRIQYIEETHPPRHQLPFTNAGKGTICTPWELDEPGFYGAPTHLGLLQGDDYRFVPVAVAREAAGDAWIALDEQQFAIDAIPEAGRAAIRSLVEQKGVGPKTWWQFWR